MLTQKQVVFYKLYTSKRRFIATWEFVGVINVQGDNYLMTYKSPTRLTDIYFENKGLLERIKIIHGKVRYYEYILKDITKIKDEKLLKIKQLVDNGKNGVPHAVRKMEKTRRDKRNKKTERR